MNEWMNESNFNSALIFEGHLSDNWQHRAALVTPQVKTSHSLRSVVAEYKPYDSQVCHNSAWDLKNITLPLKLAKHCDLETKWHYCYFVTEIHKDTLFCVEPCLVVWDILRRFGENRLNRRRSNGSLIYVAKFAPYANAFVFSLKTTFKRVIHLPLQSNNATLNDHGKLHTAVIPQLHPQSLCHFAWQPSACVSQTLRSSYLNHVIASTT